MKVMILTNSDVHGGGRLPAPETWPSLIEPRLSEAIGEPVTCFARAPWPTPDLPSIVERWCEQEAPDVAVYGINAFWFLYESIPLRFGQKLGPFGDRFTDASLKAADVAWLTHNKPFRVARKWAQEHVGGASHFTTQEVIEVSKATVRVLMRDENRVILVRAPVKGTSYDYGQRSLTTRPQRLAEVNEAMREFCAQSHIAFGSGSPPRDPEQRKREKAADGLHSNREGQKTSADRWFDRILPLCQLAKQNRDESR